MWMLFFFSSLGLYIFSESKQVIWYLYWVLLVYVKWCSGGIERDREETREERLGFWGRSLQWRRRELDSMGWKERHWEQCDVWLHLQPQFLLPCCEHVLLSIPFSSFNLFTLLMFFSNKILAHRLWRNYIYHYFDNI